MKLNHNCVRDILLFCEDSLSLDETLSWNPTYLDQFCVKLKYSKEEIAYTLYLLDEAGYIEAHIMEADGGIYDIRVYRLTYVGHEFIDTIRSNAVWKKLQTLISGVGSISLPILQQVGGQILLTMLNVQ